MAKVHIHGKRIETIYAFTVEYKGEKITGRYITVNGEDENEPLGLPEDDEKFEFDNIYDMPGMTNPEREIFYNKIKQAIKAYDKAHR